MRCSVTGRAAVRPTSSWRNTSRRKKDRVPRRVRAHEPDRAPVWSWPPSGAARERRRFPWHWPWHCGSGGSRSFRSRKGRITSMPPGFPGRRPAPATTWIPFSSDGNRLSVLSHVAHRRVILSLIEGNRGLYDGMNPEGEHSTAELAKLLRSPVVLVVDCDKVTRTTGAMVLGCQTLDPGVDIRGVILNRVGTSRHAALVKKSIEEYCRHPSPRHCPEARGAKISRSRSGISAWSRRRNTTALKRSSAGRGSSPRIIWIWTA